MTGGQHQGICETVLRRVVSMISSRADEALKKAATCAERAGTATDPDMRAFYIRLRDSWLNVANQLQVIDSIEDDLADMRMTGSRQRSR
jgi:hypothetical protein